MNQTVTGADLVRAIESITARESKLARLNYRESLREYISLYFNLDQGFADSELIDLLSNRPAGFDPTKRPEQLSRDSERFSGYIDVLSWRFTRTFGTSPEDVINHLEKIFSDPHFDELWREFNRRRLLLSAVKTVLRPLHYKWMSLWGESAANHEAFRTQLVTSNSLLEQTISYPAEIEKWQGCVWELFDQVAIFRPNRDSEQTKPRGKVSDRGKRLYENSWETFFSEGFHFHEHPEQTVLAVTFNQALALAEKRRRLNRDQSIGANFSADFEMPSTANYFTADIREPSSLQAFDTELGSALYASRLNFELRNRDGEKVVDRTWLFTETGFQPKFKAWLTQLSRALDLNRHPFNGELIITSPDGEQRVQLHDAKLADLIKWARAMF